MFHYNIGGDTVFAKYTRAYPSRLKAKEYMDKGELVPDQVTIDLLWDKFDSLKTKANDDKIILFDGFPRTLSQGEALDAGMKERNQKIDMVIYFDVSDEILIQRLTGRRTCPECGATYHLENNPPKKEGICDKCGSELIQRVDDSIETVKNRIEVYNNQTSVLIDYYSKKGILKSIDGTKKPDEVYKEFENKLEELN